MAAALVHPPGPRSPQHAAPSPAGTVPGHWGALLGVPHGFLSFILLTFVPSLYSVVVPHAFSAPKFGERGEEGARLC